MSLIRMATHPMITTLEDMTKTPMNLILMIGMTTEGTLIILGMFLLMMESKILLPKVVMMKPMISLTTLMEEKSI